MSIHQSASVSQALYRVFVLPNLSSSVTRPVTQQARCSLQHPRFTAARNPFSTTCARSVKTRPPESRKELWNEEITARLIYLVDPSTNELYKDPTTGEILPPRTRYDVLNRIDQTQQRLVQFPHAENPELGADIPVCKVVDKKAAYLASKKRKEDGKDRRKIEVAARSTKTLELNWAIDGNDLQHRLERMQEFLLEGRKVEVVLASKKKGRKATAEECEDVLKHIRKAVGEVNGAKENKAMEGKVGGFVTLSFQGKAAVEAVKAV